MMPRLEPIAPVLVFAWGNPSRGDDALGPLLIERLCEPPDRMRTGAPLRGVEMLTDFQLLVEHALDLGGRKRVLFVDASVGCEAPFEVTVLQPSRDASFTTHSMSPEAVMQVFRQLHGVEPPPCTLLAIRGERFELGDPPSDAALANLALATAWCRRWLAEQVKLEVTARMPCMS